MGMPEITSGKSSREQAITDIITSVALQQTALSHILNAEGEKIQKGVVLAKNIDEMICVNKSVNQMVDSISKLELLLQNKLQLFNNYFCDKKEQTDIL